MSAPELMPCPFCGGGITSVEAGGQIWRGVNGYSEPQFYHLLHFGKLSETDDFPRCFVEFRCRTEAEAIAAWNQRADTATIKGAVDMIADQHGWVRRDAADTATWNAAIRAAAEKVGRIVARHTEREDFQSEETAGECHDAILALLKPEAKP